MADPFLAGRAAGFDGRIAIHDRRGEHRYGELLDRSSAIAAALAGRGAGPGARVGYLVEPGADHVAVQWGIWRAGAIAVPIALSHPAPEIAWLLDDAAPAVVVADPGEPLQRVAPLAAARAIPALATDRFGPGRSAASGPDPGEDALIVYTSGTTGRPKGVVTTHRGLRAQITTMVEAWGWTAGDRILHVLPLHHVHGIANALCCPLFAGAAVEFLAPFDPIAAWERLGSGEITVFTAVPTVYARLIAAHDAADPATRARWSAGARRARLMMSGSAALPVSVLAGWEERTGHRLLERYGMTEIGMALANPLAGERRAGTVGQPMPGVEARIVDDAGHPAADGPGQLEIRGPQVFREYWRRPEETARAFRDGWFRTGDVAVIENGYYRLLGRESTDIIKSAGYKISALEIEECLRGHPAVADCAVVGLADEELGERVAAAIVGREEATVPAPALRAWLKERLAPYKVPKVLAFVPDLPRNAMGKVTKPAVRDLFPR